jgi:hypothetical protein
VLAGEQLLLASELEHRLEEPPADLMLEQARPVLGETALVEGGVFHIQVQEPLEEQVVLQPLAELALAANRVEGHQQAGLEQMLGRDGGPTGFGVHGVEDQTELGQHRINQRLDGPDRLIRRDELLGREGEE